MTNDTAETYEIELDSRQRLPLAKLLHGDQRRFRAEVLGDGDILLTPVVSISERELAVLRNEEVSASIRQGIAESAAGLGTHHKAGHFAKLAAELPEED